MSRGISKEDIPEDETEYLNRINSIRDKVREPILKLSAAIKGRRKGHRYVRDFMIFYVIWEFLRR